MISCPVTELLRLCFPIGENPLFSRHGSVFPDLVMVRKRHSLKKIFLGFNNRNLPALLMPFLPSIILILLRTSIACSTLLFPVLRSACIALSWKYRDRKIESWDSHLSVSDHQVNLPVYCTPPYTPLSYRKTGVCRGKLQLFYSDSNILGNTSFLLQFSKS